MKNLIPLTLQSLLTAGLILLTQDAGNNFVEGYVVVMKFVNGTAWLALAVLLALFAQKLSEARSIMEDDNSISEKEKSKEWSELEIQYKPLFDKIDKAYNRISKKKGIYLFFLVNTAAQILLLAANAFYTPAVIAVFFLLFLSSAKSEYGEFTKMRKKYNGN